MKGIYCYRDLENNDKIVYIGKDSNIHRNKRHNDHIAPSNYNSQPFNRILQKNLNRYKYEVLRTGDFKENLLKVLEILYIKRYGTYDNRKGYGESYGFNFTVGGDGSTGYKWSDEQKRNFSERMKGENSLNYARIVKSGVRNNKQEFVIKKDARIIKHGKKRGKQTYCIIKDGKKN